MRVVVSGLIGQYAFGGVTWDYIQYVLGFQQLGCDVWYLEDTGAWAYDPVAEEPSANCSHNVAYLRRVMEEFDLGDRWIYRNGADGIYHGAITGDGVEAFLAEADVLVNVSGACWLRDCTAAIPRKLFLDGDPMFTQIGMLSDEPTRDRILAHEEHYSFGLRIGTPGSKTPSGGVTWKPTVQPIAIDYWDQAPGSTGGPWTTVLNWSSYRPKEFEGQSYGQKGEEFMKYIDLPSMVDARFTLAMGQGVGRSRPTDRLEACGWEILEPDVVIPDFQSYHDFIGKSKAEWSIAKNGYVKGVTGWFSCRSACYLAAGKPVVVQDTGWREALPSGDGVIGFSTAEEAVQGIERVNQNYEHHSKAARAYAKKVFDAPLVCQDLLNH